MPILYKKPKTKANPLRYDPTRTGPLRRRFMAQIEAKFKELERRIYQFVAVKNPFGLTTNYDPTHNTDFTWSTLDTQLEMFKEWITSQMKDLFYPGDTESWWKQYIAQGWQQGAKNVYDRWRNPSSFLASSFNQPVSVAKVKLLAARVLTELQNVTTDMATKMIRELVDGLIEGKSPREVAKDITESVDGISKQRALTIARTETIRAHAEGQLDTLETLGMGQVGIAVEFSGSGVGVTKKGNPSPCAACAHLVGIVLTLQEARGIIPVHPNCMCSFIPANVGEDGKNQIRSFQGISVALQKALKASQPKARKGVKAKQSSWRGAKVKLDKSRPTSIFNAARDQPRVPAGNPHGGEWVHGGDSVQTAPTTVPWTAQETQAAAKLYATSFINGRKICSESRAILTDGEKPDLGFETEAKILIDSVRTAQETTKTLHRGLLFDTADNPLEKLQHGQKFNLDKISSFSESHETAVTYAGQRLTGQHYILSLEGSSKTFATDHLTGMSHKEHITFGEFEVVSIKPGHQEEIHLDGNVHSLDIAKTIVIRQKAVF